MNALLVLALLFVAHPARSTPTAEADTTRARAWWRPASRLGAVTAGVARNGPAVRLLNVWSYPVADRVSVGLASRGIAARGAFGGEEGTVAGDPADVYVELSTSARPAWQVTDRIELAGSLGYGLAFVTPPGEGSLTPVKDIGFVVPLEAEVSARLSRSVGVSVSASRSIGMASAVCGTAVTGFDAVSCPAGYALDNWTATVGLRFGR